MGLIIWISSSFSVVVTPTFWNGGLYLPIQIGPGLHTDICFVLKDLYEKAAAICILVPIVESAPCIKTWLLDPREISNFASVTVNWLWLIHGLLTYHAQAANKMELNFLSRPKRQRTSGDSCLSRLRQSRRL